MPYMPLGSLMVTEVCYSVYVMIMTSNLYCVDHCRPLVNFSAMIIMQLCTNVALLIDGLKVVFQAPDRC